MSGNVSVEVGCGGCDGGGIVEAVVNERSRVSGRCGIGGGRNGVLVGVGDK